MDRRRIIICVAALLTWLVAVNGFGAERIPYDDKETRDPFEPLVDQQGRISPGARGNIDEATDVLIEGIIWDTEGKSVAIINGTLVREQDTVQGYQVLKIKKESVILQRKGKVIVVGLQPKGGE